MINKETLLNLASIQQIYEEAGKMDGGTFQDYLMNENLFEMYSSLLQNPQKLFSLFTDPSEKKHMVYTKPNGPQNIEFKPYILNEKFAKEYQTTSKDFIQIYKDGKLVSDDLFRFGGLGGNWKDNYIELLRYEKAKYKPEILKMSKNKNPKYLKGIWVVVNKYGEVIYENRDDEMHRLQHLGGDIFKKEGKVFNVRTKCVYTENAKDYFETDDYVFIKVDYQKEGNGVYRIHKTVDTNTIEFYPKTRR